MKHELQARQLPTNEELAGIYNFNDWRLYPRLFPKFVSCLSDPNGILVSHPGWNEAWRRSEFETLRESPQSDFKLNRFQHHPAHAVSSLPA